MRSRGKPHNVTVVACARELAPLLWLPPSRASRTSRIIKRAIDVVAASPALVVLSPLFAYIALRIRLDSEGPIFFRHILHLGTNMKEFTALKLRTMKVDTDQSVHQAAIRGPSRLAPTRTRTAAFTNSSAPIA
jgi:lipopolysaccharide/colanic/teichoic acid biosynthesis glycosyltransferase